MTKYYLESPIGIIELSGSESGLESLYFVENTEDNPTKSKIPSCLLETEKQLKEYFAGNRKVFNIKLHIHGTDYQKRVWNELIKINFGATASYLDIAKAMGDKNATRAVGNANGKNKISIIIPCHRIIGSSGKLTGYAGGLWRKKWLLKHEQDYSGQNLFSQQKI